MGSLAESLVTMIRRPLSPHHVELLRAVGKERDVPENALVVRSGEAAEQFHYVLEGEFELYDPVRRKRIG